MTTRQLDEAKRLWRDGKGVTEIAALIGVPRETLRYWVNKDKNAFPSKTGRR